MSLRVGLIGCGFIGKYHSRSLKDLAKSNDASVQVTATCDRNIDRAREYARILGARTATVHADELINDASLDAVYVCAETAEHPALVARAAAAGKHVFCEKPLAKSYRDAKRMLDDVTRAGIVHQVGLVLRFSPVFGVIEHMMRTHDLGALLTAHMRDDQFFPIRGHYASQWRGDVERAGGGTLIEHSIHDVDLFIRLFGNVDRVRCHTRETSGHRGIEDVAMVTFQHAGGHQTTLSSVWHAMDERQSTRHTEIFFERGYFTTEQDYFGSITYQLDKGAPVTLSHDEVIARFLDVEGLPPELTDLRTLGGLGDRRFIEAVQRGGPAFPSFAEAVAAHAVVEACYESARRGAEVAVSSVTG